MSGDCSTDDRGDSASSSIVEETETSGFNPCQYEEEDDRDQREKENQSNDYE